MKYIIPDIKDLEVLSESDSKSAEQTSAAIPDNKKAFVTDNVEDNQLMEMSGAQNAEKCSDLKCPASKGVNSLNGSARASAPDRPGPDPSKMTFDPTCLDCQRQFKDPKPEELVMYLHAVRYKVCRIQNLSY